MPFAPRRKEYIVVESAKKDLQLALETMTQAYQIMLANISLLFRQSNAVSYNMTAGTPSFPENQSNLCYEGDCPYLVDHRLGPPGIWVKSNRELEVFKTGDVLSLFSTKNDSGDGPFSGIGTSLSKDGNSRHENGDRDGPGLLLQRRSAPSNQDPDFCSVNSFDVLSEDEYSKDQPAQSGFSPFELSVPPMFYARHSYRLLRRAFVDWKGLAPKPFEPKICDDIDDLVKYVDSPVKPMTVMPIDGAGQNLRNETCSLEHPPKDDRDLGESVCCSSGSEAGVVLPDPPYRHNRYLRNGVFRVWASFLRKTEKVVLCDTSASNDTVHDELRGVGPVRTRMVDNMKSRLFYDVASRIRAARPYQWIEAAQDSKPIQTPFMNVDSLWQTPFDPLSPDDYTRLTDDPGVWDDGVFQSALNDAKLFNLTSKFGIGNIVDMVFVTDDTAVVQKGAYALVGFWHFGSDVSIRFMLHAADVQCTFAICQ